MFRIPAATGWLIAINVAVHIARLFLSPGQDDVVVDGLGFDPSTMRGPINWVAVLSLVTYQFLHGGWDHLGINMITLLAFGPGVERPLGPVRFVALYLVSGIAGALLETIFTAPDSGDLLIGASASISGTFGALLVIWGIYRRGRRPLGIVPMTLLWIGLMALTGILGVGAQGTPVAWIAHIGGFLTGMALGAILRPHPVAP
jgi:membrane associated rhomboid family serine protease